MPIFQNHKNTLTPINELKFDLEKDIQKLTEQNLETVFGLQFVATEFTLNGLRIDTLAFDKESKAFVIIEYKRDRSFSVIDQGFAYLGLLVNNKADFLLDYNERFATHLTKNDVDWSQSRVIFIANSFTIYQQQALTFKDLAMELWEVKKYSNQTISYTRLKSSTSTESISTISKNATVEKVSREVKAYAVDDHFKPGMENVRTLFEALQEKIIGLDSRIEESTNASYITYKIGWKNVVSLAPYKNKIVVSLPRTKPAELKDPMKKTELIPNSMKYYGQNITRLSVLELADAEYAFSLIRQTYERLYK
jgi:predicted transport protein